MKKFLLLLATLLPAPGVEIRVATFNVGAFFTESSGGVYYPLYGLGAQGTLDHESVKAILARIDADVVALQEIDSADVSGSPNDVARLAASLGYPHVHIAANNASGGLTAPFDSDLRVAFLSRHPFLSATSIRSPAGAREMTRLHAAVKVDVPGTSRDPYILTGHLKSGGTHADRFRRAVEMKRLAGHLDALGLTDNDNFIVTGDFNLNPNYTAATYQSLPSGIPGSYALGADYPFPIGYSPNPLFYFGSPGAVRLDPRQLDGSAVTFPQGAGYTLDLMLVSPALAGRPHAAEVYNSALDTSNAAGLPKAGAPPAAGTSDEASDHFAVFADLELDPAAPAPYTLAATGVPAAETFAGFTGQQAPPRWNVEGGLPWQGSDDGTFATAGMRSYRAGSDGSLGWLPAGAPATATATFSNQTGATLSALQVACDLEQWRATAGGAADRVTAELVVGGQAIPLTRLAHTASTDLPTGAVPGGAATARSTAVAGLSIPQGASFDLRFTFDPGTGGGVPPDDIFINELHYDNAGTDTGEFVEIAVGPGYAGGLSDIALVLYNGSGGTTYGTHALDTFTAGDATPSGHRLYSKAIAAIQNGVDGFALVVGGTVKHFISYEGTFTATAGPAAGMVSTDIGVGQSGSETIGQASLGLTGSGGSAADFSWQKFNGIAHTPGQANSGQSFVLPGLPPQGLAIDNVRVTGVAAGDSDGDGQPDADELAFGTDPLEASSVFRPAITRDGGLALHFPGAVGITYSVEFSDNLTAWEELSVHTGAGQIIAVPLPAIEPTRFFRVKAGE